MLPCAKHGCDVVEDGDDNEGFRVGSVDAAVGVGTREDYQAAREADEAPAIGAYVVKFEVCMVSVLIALVAAGVGTPLTGRLQV